MQRTLTIAFTACAIVAGLGTYAVAQISPTPAPLVTPLPIATPAPLPTPPMATPVPMTTPIPLLTPMSQPS